MTHIEVLKTYPQIKALADPRRLEILQHLMASSATLSQLGRALGEHPAWVRHHVQVLQDAGLVEMKSTVIKGGFVEKYYQAHAQAFLLQQTILPKALGQQMLILFGSHDLALEHLAARLHQERLGVHLLPIPVGSLNGLAALRQGNAHLAGCHLLDFVTGEYNLPYIRHFFPDQEPWVITLAEREQGLITIPGNPHQVYSLADLAGRNINFINRKRGSGTRLWIDHQLHQYGIPATHIQGYQGEVGTHTAVAQAILCGQADVGISIYAAAQQYGLAFIPLFTERYDLVIPADLLDPAAFSPLLDLLQTASIRQEISTLGGYNTAHTGERKIL